MTNNKVILLLDQFPVITLDNGVMICNFSSFHDYWLRTDENDKTGIILPACTKEVADYHKLITNEAGIPRWKGHDVMDTDYWGDWEFEYHKADPNNPDWIDVNLNMEMDSHTIKDLCTLAEMKELHVILVPYPIQAILNEKWGKDTRSYIIWCKSRTCRKIDPRDITQGIYSNKFCV